MFLRNPSAIKRTAFQGASTIQDRSKPRKGSYRCEGIGSNWVGLRRKKKLACFFDWMPCAMILSDLILRVLWVSSDQRERVVTLSGRSSYPVKSSLRSQRLESRPAGRARDILPISHSSSLPTFHYSHSRETARVNCVTFFHFMPSNFTLLGITLHRLSSRPIV